MDKLDLFFLWIGLPLWIGGMLILIVLLHRISQGLRELLDNGIGHNVAEQKRKPAERRRITTRKSANPR